MIDLPSIMVAPNGARKTRADHPALPVTIDEIVKCAVSCFDAGAKAIHAHVRDTEQRHVLDAGLYLEFISEMKVQAPKMQVQITTEAVGLYSPAQMRKLVRIVMPEAVSVSIVEMLADGDETASRTFYQDMQEAKIAVQHILYSADQLGQFLELVEQGTIPGVKHQLLFVLGRYAANQESNPMELDPFLKRMHSGRDHYDWAVCAFGKNETECLNYAFHKGGKARVGFENSLLNRDGSIAADNAERVAEIANLMVGKTNP